MCRASERSRRDGEQVNTESGHSHSSVARFTRAALRPRIEDEF